MDYESAFNIGEIQLEPRLQEYIKRKKFNEENDIEPPIPEEKEFCITPHDLRLIRRHKQGKKKLYTSSRLAQDPHFIKPNTDSFDNIDDDAFKRDPRYQRLQRKAQSHKDAQKKIRDLEGIDEDYTIFHQTNPYDLNPAKRPTKISKPYDDPSNHDPVLYDTHNNNIGNKHGDEFDDSIMVDSRDLVLGRSRPVRNSSRTREQSYKREFDQNFDNGRPYDREFDQIQDDDNPHRGRYCYSPNNRDTNAKFNTYNHPPRIDYKQRLTTNQMTVAGGMEHSRDLNDIIGNLDSYNKHLNKTYEYVQGEADLDTMTFRPGSRTETLREMPNSYQAIPFSYGNGLPDVTVEESLKGGIRDSSKRSIGFRNPFENQFDYISEDISDYKHSVQMWPQPTRGRDVEVARPDSAAARYDREMRAKILGKYSDRDRSESDRPSHYDQQCQRSRISNDPESRSGSEQRQRHKQNRK